MGLQFVCLKIAGYQTIQQKKYCFNQRRKFGNGVSDLVDWQTHQWDRERIMAMFHQFDVEAILQVPLSRRVV